MRKSKIDREKLFQIFCVYVLALVASIAAGQNVGPQNRPVSQDIGIHADQAPVASVSAKSN